MTFLYCQDFNVLVGDHQSASRVGLIKELHNLLHELKSDDEIIADLAQKNEHDEATILKRLQWMLASNPRIEPIVTDVIRIKKERKLVLNDFLTLKLKVISFVEGVILFETMRLAGKIILFCIKKLTVRSRS